MGIHKLVLEEDFGYDFGLVAIHCSVEVYQIAFLLNKHLDFRLRRTEEDVAATFKDVCAYFPVYHYEDNQQCISYDLIGNHNQSSSNLSPITSGLFGAEVMAQTTNWFLPELKKVDFFLKITEDECKFPQKFILQQLNQIALITTAYAVEISGLKMKENLIFE